MSRNYYDEIREEVRQNVKRIIDEVMASKEENPNPIDDLVEVNKKINEWLTTFENVHIIDETIKKDIEEAKELLVEAAKNEIAENVANIIKQDNGNIIAKINAYLEDVKAKGIILDDEELQKRDFEERTNIVL